MTNVFLAYRSLPYERPDLIGVFTSLEKANEFVKLQREQDEQEDPDIQWEYAVDRTLLDPIWD
jgi:hypothetical protein